MLVAVHRILSGAHPPSQHPPSFAPPFHPALNQHRPSVAPDFLCIGPVMPDWFSLAEFTTLVQIVIIDVTLVGDNAIAAGMAAAG